MDRYKGLDFLPLIVRGAPLDIQGGGHGSLGRAKGFCFNPHPQTGEVAF